jgi:gliding motility-associated-like protein
MDKLPKIVFTTRSKKWLLLLLLGFIFLQGKMSAQGCECAGCQGSIPISATNTYTLNISGAANNDLSDAGQGICGIYLDVSFEHIWSLTITLTAPSGQSIILMGPYDNFPSTTGFSNWDISFLPCGNSVSPDPIFSGGFFNDQWTNLQQWAFFTNYTGSYYPYLGCLEDFDSGSVNGDWTITVTNGSSVYDDGSFNGFSIQFCDDTGMGCTACDANAGDLSVVNDIDLCIGEDYSGGIDPSYTFGSEPNNQYDYTYIISQSSIIESYEMTPDFSTFPEGIYEVCGLSYLLADTSLIPLPNGTLSTTELEMMMTSTASFCGDISDDCFVVIVYPLPDTIFISDEFCQGETYNFAGNVYGSGGVYYPTLPASVGCDTIVALTLNELEVFSQNIFETICQGDTFFIESFFHTSTGVYRDTLTTILGCDSIINLDLTVLNPQVGVTIPDTIICSNLEIPLNASGSTGGSGVSYLWSTNEGNITGNINDNMTTVDAAGKYYFMVTQVSSGVVCTAIDSVQVMGDLVAPTVSVAMDSMINCNIPIIVLDGNGTSVGSGFTYEWTTVDGNVLQDTFTLFATINSGGTYILNVTNHDNDCLAQDSVLILQNTSFPSTSAGADLEINCTNPIIQLDGSSSSQGNAYIYIWTTSDGNILLGEEGLQPTVDSAGTYQLTVTDTFSYCMTIDFVDVMIDTLLPIADAGNDFIVNCFTPEVQIDATNSSQGGQFSYQWNALSGGPIMNGETTLMPTINIGGTYELVVTNDLTGCSSSSQVTVNQDFMSPSIVVNTSIDTITCLVETVTIDALNSSTGVDFEYEWTVINSGNLLLDTFTLLPQIDLEGMYQLEITNIQNGCTSVETVEVFANNIIPTVEAGANMTVDCNSAEVVLAGSGSVGGEFEYLWTAMNGGNILSGGTTFLPIVNGDGDYELLVTNTSSGCIQTDIVSVNVDTIPPVAVAGIDTLIDCYNSIITLDGSNSSVGDFSYLWSTFDGAIDLGETTLQPVISAGGNYDILVTNNQNGCSAFDSVFVGENLITPISVAGQDTIITCTNPTILLDGTGSSIGSNFSYQWTATNGGNILLNPNSFQPEITSAGTYQLVVTNTINGCTSMDEVLVIADTDSPVVDAGQNMTVDCNQLEVILNGSGSVGVEFEYMWTATNGGNILNGENTLSPIVNGDGDYELLVTNTVSGCLQTDLVSVNVDTIPPVAAAGIDTLINCYNNTITLMGGNSSLGDFSYFWSTTDGVIEVGQMTLQPTISSGGNYTLLVTNNQNSCSAFDSVFVGENFVNPNAFAGQDTFVNCNNPTILLNGNGSSEGSNFSYQWMATNGGNILANPNSLQPEINSGGNYQLVVTNTINGCTSMDEVVVAEYTSLPIADAGSPDALTCNQIVINLDGLSSSVGINIIYLWTTVDGNIIFGENTLTPQVDFPGDYILTVADTVSGCVTQSSVGISMDTLAPMADAGASVELNCIVQNAILDGTNSSIGNDYSYAWTTTDGNIFANQNSLQPTVNELGMYYLEVISEVNGCTAEDSVFVSQNITIPISTAGVDTLITCDNSTLILNGTGSSIGTNYIYQWTATNGGIIDNNSSSLQPQISALGNYELVVTDLTNGCFATDFLTVDADTNPPTADAGSPDVIDCNQLILTLDGSFSSMGSIYEYEWITGDGNVLSGGNTLTPQIDSAGTYVLEVINTANGCTNVSIVTITSNTIFPIADAGVDTMITCESNVINLNGANSSTGNVTYNWTTTGPGSIINENTLTPAINDFGIYQLEITNAQNGCVSTAAVEVVFDTIVPIADAGLDGNLDCDTISLILGGNSSMGANFEYQWTSSSGGNILMGSTQSNITVNAGATYSVLVTNILNGCTATDEVTIIQDTNLPIAITNAVDTILCDSTQLILNGNGSSVGDDFTYDWITIDGNIIANENTLFPIVDSVGLYILTVTNTSNNCKTISFVNVVLEDCGPIVFAGADGQVDCNFPTTILDGTGSSVGTEFIYSWITIDGVVLSGATTLMPTVGAGGTYVLVVENTLYGSVATDTVFVENLAILPSVDLSVNALLNCVDTTAFVDGSNSSSGTDFLYSWSTDIGNIVAVVGGDSISIDESGFYFLEITNTLNGCVSIDSVEVFQNVNAPVSDAGVNAELNCYNSTFTLDGSGSSLGSDFVYSWTTPDGDIVSGDLTWSPMIDLMGTYILEVTDTTNGCFTQSSVMVTENFIAPNTDAGMTDVLTCIDSILTLDGTASSQGNNFNYEWTTVDGNILNGENSLTPQVDSSGNYQLIILDALNGCSDTSTVFINLNFIAPMANAGMDTQIDCGIGSIFLNGNSSSMGADFSYLWTTFNGTIQADTNTLSPEISTNGNYFLTVENTINGCTSTNEVVVNEVNCFPIVTIDLPDTLTCLVTQIILDGSASSNWGTIKYEWTTVDGNIIGVDNLPAVNVDLPGTYQLVLTDTLTNEIALGTVIVAINNTDPIAEAGIIDTLNCLITSLNLDGSASSMGGLFGYEWTTSNGNIANGFDELQPLIDEAGTYDLLVTNTENGCTATSSVLIEVDTILPTVDLGFPLDLTCVNTVLFLDGLGSSMGNNFTNEWTTGDGNIIGNTTTLSPQIDEAGVYELTILNTQNFCEANSQILIGIDTLAPTILIEPAGVLNCALTEIELDANASSFGNDFTIQWQTLAGNFIDGSNSLSPQVNEGGDYELTILNTQNGCIVSEIITVLQDTLAPISDAGSTMELTCLDTVLTLDGSNSSSGIDFVYQWQTLNGNIENGGNSLFSNINLVGDYELVVTNSNSLCTSISQVQVTQDITVPVVVIDSPDTLGCEIETIILSASNSSNEMIYSYLWSTNNGNIDFGETSLNPQISDGGQYVLAVTNDENGCTASNLLEIVQDTISPISEAGTTMTLTCLNTVLTLSGNGSSTGNEFTYEWSTDVGNFVNGTNSLNPEVDAFGIYQLVVTNHNNMCTASDFVDILENNVPPEIEVNAIGGLILNCNVSSIVLDASGSSPIGNVSFEWSTINGSITTGNTDANPEVALEGGYQLILTNEINACTAVEMVQISTDFVLPIVQILEPDTLTCLDTLVVVSGSGSSIGSEFEYLWTHTLGSIVSGETDLECMVDEFGGYILTVLNTENGCIASEAVTVYQNTEEPFAEAGGNYEFDCIQTVKVLQGVGSQGSEFSYQWTTVDGNFISGATTLEPIIDAFGTYILTVTNQLNGCEATSIAIVTEDLDVPQNVELAIISPLCFGDSNGSIEVMEVIGGEAPYLYSINESPLTAFPLFSNLPVGNYSITIQDASGCEWNSMVELFEQAEVMVDLGADIYLELGESTVLQAMTNILSDNLDSVSWVNFESLECEDCLEQEITPLFSSGYGILLMDENGCATEDEIIVYVNNKKRIFIPNVFSPNGDGFNDVFMIYGGLGIDEIESFQIFSRWGDLVFAENNFQPNDSTKGWNGSFKGERMNPAVFVFFAKIKYTNGETEIMKGDLFLK